MTHEQLDDDSDGQAIHEDEESSEDEVDETEGTNAMLEPTHEIIDNGLDVQVVYNK